MYVATEHDSAYAFDADGGGTLWSESLLGPGMIPAQSSDTTGVSPEIGVLATPVIDTNTGTIYMVAMVNNNGNNQFWLHALDITNGDEKFGGPIRRSTRRSQELVLATSAENSPLSQAVTSAQDWRWRTETSTLASATVRTDG